MKRLLLAGLALVCFSAVTFAQVTPDAKKKEPTEKSMKKHEAKKDVAANKKAAKKEHKAEKKHAK